MRYALFVVALVTALTPNRASAVTCPPNQVYPCYSIKWVLQCGAPESRLQSAPQPELCSQYSCNDIETYQPAGTACTDDGNACTSDVCDGNGTCTHNNATGGVACGASCISPGTCCDNTSCTGGMVCTGAGGSCVCPGGTTNCNGTCINAGTCCTNNDCTAGGHVCSGAGGSCTCQGGYYDCQGTCIPNGTCCTSPSTCGAGVANGSSVCPSNGGQCVTQCNGGFKGCAGSCVANAACCTDADCTALNNDSAHTRGVCPSPGGSCVSTCNAGYKACAGSCIPQASCCSAADCTSPPNGCYKQQGTCSAGACSYAFNDGASCNADSDACTPNDTCKSGSCVADTAHQVTCLQRDCHTAPACNHATGNCDDSAVADGTACGANGCAETQGMCAGGACTSAPKDCTSLDTACQVGSCDASKPVGTPCAPTNKPNGTACATDNKCIIGPACSGGSCTGAIKACTPSGPCRTAACDPTSGNCGETVAPAGSACSAPGSCIQNTTCDANGTCVGDPLPDNTPCENSTCQIAAVCGSGQCICAESIGTGKGGTTSVGDGGTTTSVPKAKGCSTTPGSPGSPIAFLMIAALFVLTRRRARS